MANKSFRPCIKPGCIELVRGGGYCDKHKPAEAERRESAAWHHLYRTKWWKDTRAEQLLKEPFCRECAKKGIRKKATDVDHIKPHKGFRKLFSDKANLQSLCHSCHSKKTALENTSPRVKNV